jgi:hypothetical protein
MYNSFSPYLKAVAYPGIFRAVQQTQLRTVGRENGGNLLARGYAQFENE